MPHLTRGLLVFVIITCASSAPRSFTELRDDASGGASAVDVQNDILFCEQIVVPAGHACNITSSTAATFSAGNSSRLFLVAGELSLSGLALRDGRILDNACHEMDHWMQDVVCSGGTIYVGPGGVLVLYMCDVDFSLASSYGGAVFASSGARVEARRSLFAFTWSTMGGAVYGKYGSTVTVADSRFFRNSAASAGGGVAFLGAGSLSNCSLEDNSAKYGAAMFVFSEDAITISDSVFQTNTAAMCGGALATYEMPCNLSITDSTFVSNIALDGGGVCAGDFLTLTISDSEFVSNSVYGTGGAVFSLADSLVMERTTFRSNYAQVGGALASGSEPSSSSTVTIQVSESTFTTNVAVEYGGSMAVFGRGVVSVYESSFVRNAARLGGAAIIALTDGGMTMRDSSFLLNSADEGGALYLNLASAAVLASNFTANRGASCGGALFMTSYDDARGGAASHGDAPPDVPRSQSSQSVAVVQCVFDANSAELGGGVFADAAIRTDVTESAFTANSAATQGGAVFVSQHGEATFSWSAFVYNVAQVGESLFILGVATVGQCVFEAAAPDREVGELGVFTIAAHGTLECASACCDYDDDHPAAAGRCAPVPCLNCTCSSCECEAACAPPSAAPSFAAGSSTDNVHRERDEGDDRSAAAARPAPSLSALVGVGLSACALAVALSVGWARWIASRRRHGELQYRALDAGSVSGEGDEGIQLVALTATSLPADVDPFELEPAPGPVALGSALGSASDESGEGTPLAALAATTSVPADVDPLELKPEPEPVAPGSALWIPSRRRRDKFSYRALGAGPASVESDEGTQLAALTATSSVPADVDPLEPEPTPEPAALGPHDSKGDDDVSISSNDCASSCSARSDDAIAGSISRPARSPAPRPVRCPSPRPASSSATRPASGPATVRGYEMSFLVRELATLPSPALISGPDQRILAWSLGMQRATMITAADAIGTSLDSLPFATKCARRALVETVASMEQFSQEGESQALTLHLRTVTGSSIIEMFVLRQPLGHGLLLLGREVDPSLSSLLFSNDFDNEELGEDRKTNSIARSSDASAEDDVNAKESEEGGVVNDCADALHPKLSLSVRRFNAFSHELEAPRSHTHPMANVASRRSHHWDSDSSGTRKRQTRFCLDDRSDLRTREDDLGVHRADRRENRRRTRQDNACHSALVKLRAIGTFLRIARECASLRVLFDGDQATDPAFAVPLTARRAVVAHTWIGAWRGSSISHGWGGWEEGGY